MNKKDTQKIKDILNRLNQGIAYLKRDDIFICIKNTISALPEDRYTNPKGLEINPLVKFCGCDLAQLLHAREGLINLIPQEVEND